ncbi:MAG TPA: TolC family protein [Terriglobia bacterium]|nr:TolC family protein [Terriglobia bacterium]
MREHRGEGRRQKSECRKHAALVGVALISLCVISKASGGQDQDKNPNPVHPSNAVTALGKLVVEVQQKNPQVLAARHGWKAASQVPSQVSTLPDPEFTVQQFSVGSPRPFAGYTNSDFAYLGLGISQDLPYPGKLKLKGEAAQREASGAEKRYESVLRSAVEQLKAAYFRLAYLQKTLSVLDRDGELLDQIEKIAEAHYRVGQGSQAEVLKAQLQQTQLLREIAMHHQEMWTQEAQLKQILNRPPDSEDLMTEDLSESPLPYTYDELLERVRAENPEVAGVQEMVRRQSTQVEMARKDFYPDFNLQYMWQHTGPQFRDYYMLTLGVKVPIFRSRKQQPEVAQAVEELNRSRREYEGAVQQAYFEVRDQFLAAQTSAELLKIYREGLIPQSTAAFQAGLTAYQSNRFDMESVLSSFHDVLNFDEEYWRTLAEHETALARLEQLTGIEIH